MRRMVFLDNRADRFIVL